MGQLGPKRVGISGFYNISVNLIQLCTYVGLFYSNLIVMHVMENVKRKNL